MWKFRIILILLGTFAAASDVLGDPTPSISQKVYATQSGYNIVIFDQKLVLPAANPSLPMDSQAIESSPPQEPAQSEVSQGTGGSQTISLEAQLPQITSPMSSQAEAFNQAIRSSLDNRSYGCDKPQKKFE